MDNKDFRDYLTGISNRMGLFDLFGKLNKDMSVCVMFMDLDNFKTINDKYGHKKGDEVLIRFARLIEEVMPNNTIVSRLGGDEFATIIQECSARGCCSGIAEKVLSSVRELRKTDKAFEIISVSIGIICDYDVKNGLDRALNCADKAMYYAKEQGKNTFIFYSDLEKQVEFEAIIEKDLFRAINEGRIFVNYHPVHHLQSSRLICTEACCLWETPSGKVIGRNDFRSILIKEGLIDEVDMFVFGIVCRDYEKWGHINNKTHKVCVQFSHLVFLDESRVEQIKEIVNKYDVNPACIEIAFDETMFSSRITPERLIDCMNKLRDIGFSLGLSHFGEDFSSVRYLKDLPISKLFLYGDFISENIKSPEGREIIRSIVKLGRGFRFILVGCQVDDSKSMLSLAECGCDAATGDFFTAKLPVDEYIEYVKKNDLEDGGVISYNFLKDFSANKRFTGAAVVGEDVVITEGVSKKWGGVSFPGGASQTNYLSFPPGLFDGNGYSFSMWIKPKELQNWVSALYVRFQNGFVSFMPNVAGGRCMLRTIDDADMYVWHDAMTSGLPVGKWTFVACTYDSMSAIARIYINGELEAELTDVPKLSNPQEVWLGSDVFQISFCGVISSFQVGSSPMEIEEIRSIYKEFIEDESFVNEIDRDNVTVEEITVHDPAIYEDKENRKFYIYGTGGEGYVSRDLVHWKNMGKVIDRPSSDAAAWTKSDQIWAPDIVKVGDEYRLYCSNSSWGVNQSCIFMATSDKPAGPFVPKAAVLKTGTGGTINAIDANIIEDHETHRQYMVYGSFWSGIYIVELDKETGLLKDGETYGKQIATRPLWNDGAIEGPYIIYHPETKYYYLFVSYGSLKSDYNIRVARSREVTGPYLDYNGVDMVNPMDDNCSTGLMISCGYRFMTGEPMMGPGHNSVLLRENGEMFLVSHIRKMAFIGDPGPGLLQIRKMVMTPDGWPIALGEPYNAETLLRVRNTLLYGDYERIELRPSIPQGLQHAHLMRILEGGRLEMGSVIGSWTRVDDFSLKLEYGPITEYVHFEKGLDKEKNKTSVIMGGLTSQGIATWAKKEDLEYCTM